MDALLPPALPGGQKQMAVGECGQRRGGDGELRGQLAPLDQPGAGDEGQPSSRVVDGVGVGLPVCVAGLTAQSDGIAAPERGRLCPPKVEAGGHRGEFSGVDRRAVGLPEAKKRVHRRLTLSTPVTICTSPAVTNCSRKAQVWAAQRAASTS